MFNLLKVATIEKLSI